MDTPSPLFFSTLLCSLEQHSLLSALSRRMKKKCFQLNLLSGLGFNPFSHSTYIWRGGIIILPRVAGILLPMLTCSEVALTCEPHIICVARTVLTYHLKLGFKMNFLACGL